MNVRTVALNLIDQILGGESYSNLALNRIILDGGVAPVDVGLLTELVYGTVQNKLKIDFYLHDYVNGKKMSHYIRNLLRMSVYQMIFLDKIPNHAIIHEAVEIAKDHDGERAGSFVNAVLRNITRNGVKSVDTIENSLEKLSIDSSHPTWLVNMWAKQYNEDLAHQLCTINQTKPYQFARLNLFKKDKNEILDFLKEEHIQFKEVDGVEEAIYVTENNLANSEAFRQGYLTIQDVSSMIVGKVLGPEPNDQVLDTCSAPGGKATHMAELMNNQGTVVACDVHEHKINLIRQTAKRLGTSIVKPVLCDATQLTRLFERSSFDKVLVDAPCSGFGVIRRKPEIKYNKQPSDLDVIIPLQQAIIDEAVQMVKPGGRLVYSTCTINKKENEKMVEYILKNYPDYTLDKSPFDALGLETNGMIQLIDQYMGSDVFFISCFKRKVMA